MKQKYTRNTSFFSNIENNNYIKHSYVPCVISFNDEIKNKYYKVMEHINTTNKSIIEANNNYFCIKLFNRE